MRIRISAGGIFDGTGKEIPVGTETDVADHDNDTPHPWAGRFEIISGSRAGKTPATNETAPVGPFTVAAGAAGWFNILDANGEKVGKGLREDDAKAFSDLSTDDQAEFAAEHAKA